MPTGRPWEPGLLVPLRVPELRLEATLMVSEVTVDIDRTSAKSRLTLVRPDSYSARPEPFEDAVPVGLESLL